MSTPLVLSDDLSAELKKRNLTLVCATDVENFLDLSDVVTLPSWPEFMMNDSVANKHWRALNERFPQFQFALIDGETEKWITVGNSIPIHFSGQLESLPDAGWDWAVLAGIEAKAPPNLLCALAIQILPEYRGQSLSTLMIRVMKEIGLNTGLDKLVAPVRPNKKSDYPLLPMETYIKWSREGLPFDPWLRVHQRLGARILKVCPEAMRIVGSISEWMEWTGLSFQSSGDYIIPGALSPISIDMDKDEGIYIEPNVWMLHK